MVVFPVDFFYYIDARDSMSGMLEQPHYHKGGI